MEFPLLLFWLAACYRPPDLPLIDEVPIIAGEGECAPMRTERVVCTIDGDTFAVGSCLSDQGERFRMLGIDAPETAKEGTPAECWSEEASAELERLLDSELATVTFDDTCTDVYGRSLAYVWLTGEPARDLLEEDRTDEFEPPAEEDAEPAVLINEWMVAKGFARLFDEEWAPTEELRFGSRLTEAERAAKGRRLGLWGVCDLEG